MGLKSELLLIILISCCINMYCCLKNDLENPVLSDLKNQFSFTDTRIRNQQYHFSNKIRITYYAMELKSKPVQILDSPPKVITAMDYKIDELSKIKAKSPCFSPLNEYAEIVEEELANLISDLVKMRDDFQSQLEEQEYRFENLQLNCNFMDLEKPDLEAQNILDSYEKEKEIITEVITLKVKNIKSQGTEKNKETNDIKSTARILVKDCHRNTELKLKQLETKFIDEFKQLTGNCTKANQDMRMMNNKFNEDTRQVIANWTTKLAEIQLKIVQLENIYSVQEIVKVENNDTSKHFFFSLMRAQLHGGKDKITINEDYEIPPLNGLRKGKQVELEVLNSEPLEAILYEVQKQSRDSDAITKTHFKNEKVIQVDKWIVKY